VKQISLSALIGIVIISISLQPVFADTFFADDIVCIPPPVNEAGCDDDANNPGDVVNNILTPLGMSAVTDESAAQIFLTPQDPANPNLPPEKVIFTFMRDTGIYEFSFGICSISAVTANPVTQPQLFATQCLGAATEIFDDTGSVPGTDGNSIPPFSVATLLSGDKFIFDANVNPLAPGVPSYFYLLPNNNLAFFLANPGQFYPSQTSNPTLRAPLFSFSDANPGTCLDVNNQPTNGCDQMVFFAGTCLVQPLLNCSIFMFEDLTRSDLVPPGASDEDFTDIVFIVDAIFQTVDPCDVPIPPQECLGGEFLPIESSALLLAGLQTSAVWILPIVIAGAGAGIAAFQLRRK